MGLEAAAIAAGELFETVAGFATSATGAGSEAAATGAAA
jgi:hypothetical protein